jgi:hypothetical protein
MRNPPFSYQRVLAKRDKIFQTVLRPHIGVPLVGDAIVDVSRAITDCLPARVSPGAVFESVRVLAGTTLTRAVAGNLAWRLAGNLDKLIDGIPAFPWAGQLQDERVPICVEHMQPISRRKVQGYLFHCRALAGSPCPMLFSEFISTRSCRAISRAIGFSAPWGPYPYSTPLHFVRLIFFAHVEASRSEKRPSFLKVSASSSMIKLNRAKIEVRCRVKPCPRGFSHPCSFCWLGYDNCPAAVHPVTYVERYCAMCKSEGWFDHGEDSLACHRCRQNYTPIESDTETDVDTNVVTGENNEH